MISFIVQGNPVAKQRARICRNKYTGKVNSYTPEATADYEELVGTEAKISMGYHQQGYFESQPLEMTLKFYMPIPKTTSKKQNELMLAGLIRPSKKPDIDNICKTIQDSLNRICYKDDSQIVSLHAEKYYSDLPRVVVKISEVKT